VTSYGYISNLKILTVLLILLALLMTPKKIDPALDLLLNRQKTL
jgi:hypothetical protein